MLTADFRNKIIPSIGETLPYAFVPEKVILNNEYKIEIEVDDLDFTNENFANLIKILASLGSCNLYKLLNDRSKEKIYFLGEKFRIRKLAYINANSFSVSCESFLESKRKGKSHLNVKNLDSKEILYTFELDYHIVTKYTFENLYKDYFDDAPIDFFDNTLPKSSVNIESDTRFSIRINPFSPNQCKGHFDNFPIVPAVLITSCILREVFNILGNNAVHEVDNLEMYLNKAMPTRKEFTVEIFHRKFLRDITYFKCEVTDMSGIIYGTYIINIKTKC